MPRHLYYTGVLGCAAAQALRGSGKQYQSNSLHVKAGHNKERVGTRVPYVSYYLRRIIVDLLYSGQVKSPGQCTNPFGRDNVRVSIGGKGNLHCPVLYYLPAPSKI